MDGHFNEAVPLLAVRAAAEPLEALLAALLADEDDPVLGFAHS